jgi:methyl-accepting chemotaxis protein WspA
MATDFKRHLPRMRALEAWLTRWILARNIGNALVGGGLTFALAAAGFSMAANSFFLAQQRSASLVRWGANEVNIKFLRMRGNDAAFVLRGVTESLDDRARNVYKAARSKLDSDLTARLEELIQQTGGDNRAQFEEARTGLQRYDQTFARLFSGTAGGSTPNALRSTLDHQAQAIDPLLQGLADRAESASNSAQTAVAVATLVVGTLAVMMAVFLLRLMARAIVFPLRQLADAAEDVGRGNLASHVNIDASNELARVAQSFNTMVLQLATLVSHVQRSGISVASSVNEIAATAKQQQATAGGVAATTLEIGATSKHITATSRDLVKTISEVSKVAEQSAQLAGSGQAGLVKMEENMKQVMDSAATINAKLALLSEKAGNISQVITTITKVADQTNLLSLNAAIEAEKAGEHGRGFSVVATEIRRLADQTAVATFDIGKMVKEIQGAVVAGVAGMDVFAGQVRRAMADVQQIGGGMTQIIRQVQTLAPRIESVTEGMQAQATGAGAITQALSLLNEAAQQTVESLRQSTQAIEGLNDVSTDLRSSVAEFKLAGS